MPVLLCASVDDMNMDRLCAKALLYTLVCMQPAKTVYKGNDKGKPTWEYVQGKTIEICKDYNKPGGCKRGKNCKFKAGHVCWIKGCHKAQPAHSHSH